MSIASSNPKKAIPAVKANFLLRTRKSFTLVLPISFIQKSFPNFGRKHRKCNVHAATNSNGSPELRIEFVDEFS